jgi:hypothetical protein
MAEACSVEGCDRPGVAAKGRCWMHYARMRRTGAVGSAESIQDTARPTCSVPGCHRPVRTLKIGLCRGHYDRRRRTGDVGSARIRPRRTG